MGDALSDKLSNISIDDRFDDAVSRRSNSVSSGTKSIMTNSATKVQLLKRKKEELEKKLNEKYNQLQQVCREEAQIIGVYPVDFGSTDVNASTQTLRRRVGTSFKLPENLLGTNNNGEDEINKLMLEKQIQQQICEASLRLASDATLSKNAIKIHKQTYDAAQQKLIAINQNLSKLKKLQAQRQIKQTQDDINLHKSPPSGMTNSRLAVYNNKPVSATLAVDRKSAIRSNSVTNSPNAHHKQAHHMFNTPQMRTRHDSFGTRQEYENSGKQSPVTPTLPYHAYNHPYQQQLAYHFNSPPQLHYHYPVNVGSSATMSGYPKGVQQGNRGSKHYHHNTIQLPPTAIRQLNSSPQHHRHHGTGQIFDSNGNQFSPNLVTTTPTSSERYLQKAPASPVTPLSSNSMTAHDPTGSLVDRIESVQQAPGGYWLSMANNERIWFPVDNKYASLDRRSASTTKKLQLQSTKAISTGNIDMTAALADDAEARRREKKWCETSLDEPEFDEPKPCSPTPPLPAKKQYHRQDLQNANILSGVSPPPPPLLSRAPSEYSVNHLDNGNHRMYSRSGSTATMNRVASPRTPEIPAERPNSVMMHQQQNAVSPSNSLFASPIVGIQSPLLNESPNVTIVEEGKIVQAYQEEEKPFEMSDFYKYSTKFRQKQSNGKT